jgi:hypothetical protein
MECPWPTWEDLAETVRLFEAATLPKPEWTHKCHVAVASWYVLSDPTTALDKVRAGIQRLNAAHGVEMTPTGGYHETITVVYVALLADFFSRCGDLPDIERVWAALEAFEDKAVLLRFYSRELIMSTEARYGFVEPDLQGLPGV